ncbi:glutathione S-transferase [Xylariaceae sp. FL0255]|nr:glutathione S-transferase [Xylariaceae sp. FL0255]
MIMAPPTDLPIVLYHYGLSPYAQRLVWYLNLRKIPYSECLQPRILPRPDLACLGISYRRIPVLSIGRDIYLDTRLIFAKLESLYPPTASYPGISSAAVGNPEGVALEQLLTTRAVEGGLFSAAPLTLPPAVFDDPKFQRDRAALMGVNLDMPGAKSPFSKEIMARKRPEALGVLREYILWLEGGLLADGREWILPSGDGGPSLADIEAAWVLHWVRETLPPEILGPESAPRAHAWLARFADAVKKAATAAGKASRLKGDAAARTILGAAFAEEGLGVRAGDDPTAVAAGGLQKGDVVRVWPADYGYSHKDSGRLVAFTALEVVIEVEGEFGSVRLHVPRHGFKFAKAAMSKM